jgi:hypothetical protein
MDYSFPISLACALACVTSVAWVNGGEGTLIRFLMVSDVPMLLLCVLVHSVPRITLTVNLHNEHVGNKNNKLFVFSVKLTLY